MKNTLKNVYELTPTNSNQLSFYGKALVEFKENGDKVLYSYLTPIMVIKSDGTMYKLWDDWSATTGRHIKSFSGLNKKGYMALPLK